ncbi:class I SAM-dependent methyltransferase [Streptomyces sp. VNUA116]|uniref:class I SAM-dependent methyltransferase n=1 Tax=Streptomyces sp. VNUA116 TaxID=3062449 RepID=UPI002675E69D|nr:class I SAM-dependent methyltransferase [Streptomyces sp. VNUA116]WKU42972.1 class I SAM-dependent methyltransferase [Streptomyces sp. VNUA116]
MDDIAVNGQAWTRYGRHHLDRGTVVPEPGRQDRGFWASGPGDELLGDVTAQRILDIGSGTGHLPAHLARTRQAEVHAVEASATQHQRAVNHYAPEATNPVSCTLIAARRRLVVPPRRVTSRPRTTRPPLANAAFGVGVMSRWVWADTEALPDPLFVPSAQALRTWPPELPIDQPSVRGRLADEPGR